MPQMNRKLKAAAAAVLAAAAVGQWQWEVGARAMHALLVFGLRRCQVCCDVVSFWFNYFAEVP
jgi:hypothetical protein